MHLGIDFGTSGCRACVINENDGIAFETHLKLSPPTFTDTSMTQAPDIWWQGLVTLFSRLSEQSIIKEISAICINGTSASVVNCSYTGEALSNALMYNDTSSQSFIDDIKQRAPINHVVLSASSALSKMMRLYQENKIEKSYMLNQADWLSNKCCGQFAISDYNNALKMGYDVTDNCWPNWIGECISSQMLPNVVEPGSTLGQILPSLAEQFGFKQTVKIKCGTTDSIAAFIAAGVKDTTQAVTSLGSTLVLKVLSEKKIENSEFGLYSHKLGKYWLSGGASNTGGAVLSQYFTNDELASLSQNIDPKTVSEFNYYPLPSQGERFPSNNPYKKSALTPRPENDALFLKGIFEGIANIEKTGYELLASHGAHYPETIISSGGGSNNVVWNKIRQRVCQVNIETAVQNEACYGSALLAKYGMAPYL